MTREQLVAQIRKKESFLCVGLDPDLDKIPKHLLKEQDPVFEFNKAIIDATHHLCVAYKPNTAFYEAIGVKGWSALEKTVLYLRNNHPDIFIIADAKRGDIGNTARQYARAFFNDLDCDALTVAPYMGSDSIEPFLEFPNKFVVLLALTSNRGSADFQMLNTDNGPVYEQVVKTALGYKNSERLMFVVGATQAGHLEAIRKLVPQHFLLVPGVGAQGGSLKDVCRHGLTDQVGLLVNSSRGIIYASEGLDFDRAAAKEAAAIQAVMAQELSSRGN